MYELTISTEFCAAHAIVVQGQREPLHGHNWRVRVVVGGPELDPDGLLVDFHLVERLLRETVADWDNRNLNETPPFDRINPTAEQVARVIGERIGDMLPPGVRLLSAGVTEAPGCVASWRPDGPSGG